LGTPRRAAQQTWAMGNPKETKIIGLKDTTISLFKQFKPFKQFKLSKLFKHL